MGRDGERMTIRRDRTRRVARLLSFTLGNLLLNLEFIWHVGRHDPALWVLRVAFNGLFFWHIALARGEIGLLLRNERVLARAHGRRGRTGRGMAVIFTETTAVVFRRSVVTGSVGRFLMEVPRDAVHLRRERRGAFYDHVRGEWDDGTEMRLRFHPAEFRTLGVADDAQELPSIGPLARAVDWVRSGTTYDE
jgi:hypothetical protein